MGNTPDFDSELAGFSPRQLEAVKVADSGTTKYLLYGGALGGGKSYFLRWYGIRRLMTLANVWGIKNAVGMIACENYPALKDRQLQKIGREFPPWLGRMHQDHKEYGRCFMLKPKWGGGILVFRNLDDPSKYASAEFAFIMVDELTKNTYDIFTFLRTRLRWPGLPDVECQFLAGTNPGSIGHGWVKQLWIDKVFGDEWIKPIDYRGQFHFVKSLADDNPHLGEDYWAQLETLPPNLRKAFRYGDWNIFVGQAFPEFTQTTHRLKEALPVPRNAPLYFTFDWGFGAPFSIGWWWVDGDNRIYRFKEWYGWNKVPNEGLRLSDTDIALGIIEREKKMKIHGRRIIRLAGHDCFQKRPDYKGGGQGKPTSEIFAKHKLFLSKGDSNRELKIRAFRERIRLDPKRQTPPLLMVYPGCTQFLRTIPNLVMDEKNIEDVETTGEDHIYDETCHICMARPVSLKTKEPPISSADKRIAELYKGQANSYETMAQREHDIVMRDLQGGHDYGDLAEYDDSELYNTV